MDETLRDSILMRKRIKAVNKLISPFREHRNRRIAHYDWGKSDQKLPDYSRADITRAIGEAQILLEEVHDLYHVPGKASILFEWRGTFGDGESLVEILQRSNCLPRTIEETINEML